MKMLLTLTIALALSGCVSPQRLEGGAEAYPPQGYIKLCLEHPEVAACVPVKL